MKKLTEHYKEALIEQAIDFYYLCCKEAEISPIQVRKSISKVGSKFVFLKTDEGEQYKVRHTSTFIFCVATGREFYEKIIEINR